MNRSERLYHVLLRAYPESFRRRYEAAMMQLFRDQLRDASGSAAARAGVWLQTIVDIARSAPGERLRRAPAPLPVAGSLTATEEFADARGRRDSDRRRATWVAGSPAILLVFMSVAMRGFIDPLLDPGISIVGMPAGLLVIGLIVALSALGAWIISRASSRLLMMAALLLVTAPALVLVFVGPALVLIPTNLTT